jgi:hypothetical protein
VCYIACIVGRILRRGLSIALAAALLVACAAPTLPLPPPAIPNTSFAGLPAGEVELIGAPGSVEPNAIVFTYNTDPQLAAKHRVGGSQALGDGSWQAVIFGKSGDVVEVSQQGVDGEWSPATDVTIP